jgi:hypothetical protein
VRVFTIWQPIVVTDWGPPGTGVMARMADGRVQQYWDPDHTLARRLAADARPPQPVQECCEKDGILWDLAAVYPPGARWEDRLPPATLFSGTVEDTAEQIEAAIK